MKRQLRHIYADVTEGRLSRREALERIRALKLQEQSSLLLATPVWQAANADESRFDYAERHVIVCEPVAGDLAQRYSHHALACFERIRTILQSKPRGKVLVRIVVPDGEEQVLL